MNSTTKTVGAYEAKTKLAELLQQVEKGKEIIITKRDRPIARLVPIESCDKEVFAKIRALRGCLSLGKGETVKDLINTGRRL